MPGKVSYTAVAPSSKLSFALAEQCRYDERKLHQNPAEEPQDQ